MKKIISSSNAPAAVGPYSQAVLAGETLYISCQLGIDPSVGKLVSDDIVSQTKQILTNVKNILAEAGMSLDNVVKTTVILNDISLFKDFNATYASFFADNAPARTCFEANLPLGALVGIDFIASK